MADCDSTPHGVIYLITNCINGKKYVGQTVQKLTQRFQQHCAIQGKCRAVESAIAKYGKENFTIEELATAYSQDELNALEMRYIKEFKSIAPTGYNLMSGGGQGGVMHEDTKQLLRIGATTKKRADFMRDLLSRPDVLEKLRAHGKENWKQYGANVMAASRTPKAQMRRTESLREAWKNPELLARQQVHLEAIRNDSDAQEARRAGLVKAWASMEPEARVQRGKDLSQALLGHKKKIDYSPEAKAHRKQIKEKLFANPEFRARLLASQQTPEVVKKRGDAIRAGWARRRERLALEKKNMA